MVAGAANDNMVKTAFVVAVSVLNWELLGITPIMLANLAALCFIAPFIFLAGYAAYFAQTIRPRFWLTLLKLFEIVLALIAAVAISTETVWLLLFSLCGFGIQSALVGPLKYALIPRLVDQQDLLPANAWMESGTFVAILIGTLIGAAWIIEAPINLTLLLLVLACAGLFSIGLIPKLPANTKTPKIRFTELVHKQRQDTASMSAMWCISGFWAVGSVWLTHLPLLAVDVWLVSSRSVGTLLGQFVMGITAGALLGVFCKGIARDARVLIGASVLVIGSLLIQTTDYQNGQIGMFIAALGGGFLALPLYTMLQDDSLRVAERIAVNNVANALLIMLAAGASMLALSILKLTLPIWLLILAIGQLFLCLYHRGNLRIR